ncbi:GNAT family N-acetyltransferase [Streptomyces sp. NPDC002467]|uniref:GNAT family N-acetyltransferase n=1 Tax=Streptomyces sp. NPDC002467 TaxID=3364647 RepID=UPI00367BD325
MLSCTDFETRRGWDVGRRTGKKKSHGRARQSGSGQRAPEYVGNPVEILDPITPFGYNIVSPDCDEAESIADILQEADPDNPMGTWTGVPMLIAQDADPDESGTRVAVATTLSGQVVGAVVTRPPLAWVGNHPAFESGTECAHFTRAIGAIDCIAVHRDHRGKGLARALVTTAEQLLTDELLPFALVVHRPDLTDFYSGLGYAHVPGGLAVAYGALAVAQPWPTGYTGSWKPLRDNVSLQPVPLICGVMDVVIGVFAGGAEWADRQRQNPPAVTVLPPY